MPKLQPLKQFICDSCGALIEKPEDGWWEYLSDRKTNRISGFRIVHHRPSCMYNEQALRENIMVGDNHLSQVIALDYFGHLLNWLELTETGKMKERIDIVEFIEMLRRLYLPYWEEARQYWEQSYKDGFNDKCCFSENDLRGIIREYEDRDIEEL